MIIRFPIYLSVQCVIRHFARFLCFYSIGIPVESICFLFYCFLIDFIDRLRPFVFLSSTLSVHVQVYQQVLVKFARIEDFETGAAPV